VAKKKNNPHDCIILDVAKLKTDVEWIKKEMSDIKNKVKMLDQKVWAILIGIISILAALLASKI